MNKKDSEKKQTELALNQSNATTKTIIKISSATAYKIIKFGTHKLDLKFRFNQTAHTLTEYKEMDLLNPDNWEGVKWSDFCCNFSMSEFSKEMGLTDGGKQREEVKKMMDSVTDEKIVLKYKDREKYFPWFVAGEYIYDESDKVQSVSFRFNPGVIGAALVNSGDHYSHIELLVIGKIKSFYGLRIYELIKAFYNKKGRYGNEKGTWKTDWYSVDYMKKFLQCEYAYVGRINNFIVKAIKNPVEEINQVCKELDINLHVEVDIERGGRGGKQIKSIRFICSEPAEQVKISKSDSEKAKIEKREFNSDLIETQQLKEKYKEQWVEIENTVLELNKENPMMNQPGYKDGLFFEASVINYIKENLEK